jgi:hypothetical protein
MQDYDKQHFVTRQEKAMYGNFRFGRPQDMEGFKGRLVYRPSFLFLVSKELPPCFE